MLRDCVSEPHGFELLVFEREFGVELVVDVVDGAGLALRVQVSLLERRDPLLLVLALRHRLHHATFVYECDIHAAVKVMTGASHLSKVALELDGRLLRADEVLARRSERLLQTLHHRLQLADLQHHTTLSDADVTHASL